MNAHRSTFLIIAALMGGLAVVAGAFGAHALKEILPADALLSYKTGVRYQMWHALLLLALGAGPVFKDKAGRRIGWIIVAGVGLFSGSIYLLTLLEWRFLGPVTPIGGVLLVTAWLLLAYWAYKNRNIFHEK